MAKPKRDPLREDRIHDEAIVDAYGPEEQAMGWYCYLENKLRFPFPAKGIVPQVVSPLRKGETVEVAGPQPGGSPISTGRHGGRIDYRSHRRLALLGRARLLFLN
jgi:Calcium binding